MLRTIASKFGEYWSAAVAAPLLTLGEVVLEAILPLIIALIIDEGIEAGNMEAVLFYGAIMLVVAFVNLAIGVLAGRSAARASSGLACNLRDAEYENIQRFSFSNIDKFSTAGLVTRLTTDVTNIQNAVMMLLRVASRAPFSLICSLVACLYINAQLSVIFLVAMVFLALALGTVLASSTKIFNRVFAKYDDLNASVQENVSGIRVVKAYVREESEGRKFERAAHELARLFTKAEGRIALNNPFMMIAMYGCIIALSWFGARYVFAGTITTGELTSLLSYVMSILMSLMMLTMVFVMCTMSAASARRICEVLEEEPDITDPALPITEVADGSIRFENVSFAYGAAGDGQALGGRDGQTAGGRANGGKNGHTSQATASKYALTGINLEIRSGETIGIVGGTGAGKSTLVSLISRLYDVTLGRVLVGGRDVREYGLEPLRDAVSVVLQKNTLFSGTIMENLRWGNENATLEECQEACRLAHADEFVEKLPEGYNARVEQGGSNFSGGQKQRMCIARALLKRPRVLVLDDSTSAVDTATDTSVRAALAEHIPGTTKLIIAQRISSVENADRVLVLDGGRAVAFDTPERLLKTNDIYREMHDMQQEGGGDFDESAQKGGEA